MYNLDDLNNEQKKITLHTQGAILVSAGAGSGKTRLLTHRIIHLIEDQQIHGSNILAITFTNKATKEMRERLNQMSSKANDVWVSTFHAMCAKILRDNIHNLQGYNRYFTIYDTSDRDKVIKTVIAKMNINDDDFKNKLSYHIANAKNLGLAPNEYKTEIQYYKECEDIVLGYNLYEQALTNSNALDFDDLLFKTLTMFKNCPQVLEYYQNLFMYIHVDEFQDTNLVQYKLIQLLSKVHNNIFVVGDEDQCIYGWRGANIENIRNFISEFPSVTVYKLEQNYRSTKNIISSANKLIKLNTSRIDKTLYTENEQGDNVVYQQSYDENDESDYIARNIHNLVSKGVKYKDIGVLMRISALSRLVEEKLLNYNIPFVVSGIFKFFERLEIKNLLAYISLIVNNKDNHSLIRIINYPKRGIGQASIDKLLDIANDRNVSILELILSDDYTMSSKTKIQAFKSVIEKVITSYQNDDIITFVKNLIKFTEIDLLYSSNSEDDINRKMNIDQFIQSVQTFNKYNPDLTMIDYIQSVTLQNDLEQDKNTDDAVSISTVHASKGLEFDYVFISGLEEGCFPLSRALDSDFELEEERRLMYVALTRARKKLYLTRAKSRFLYGKRNYTIESRFIKEMGLAQKEVNYIDNNLINNKLFNNKNNVLDNAKKWNTKIDCNKDKFGKFTVGALVSHPKFGVGAIIKKENISDNTYVSVDFSQVGVKVLSLSFAPLTLVE